VATPIGIEINGGDEHDHHRAEHCVTDSAVTQRCAGADVLVVLADERPAHRLHALDHDRPEEGDQDDEAEEGGADRGHDDHRITGSLATALTNRRSNGAAMICSGK
jgi:hypothetical protein